MGKLLLALLVVVIDHLCSSSEIDSCSTVSEHNGGAGLLQARSRGAETPPGEQQAGIARKILPDSLFESGLQVLKSEAILDDFVQDTTTHHFDYPWTTGNAIEMKVVKGDAGPGYSAVDDFYGLTSFKGEGMMNMLDIGGNIGLITVGVFKKYPKNMRIIAVEPVPATYLLLRWNLWLNGIPELSLEELKAFPNKSGVLVLNTGVATEDNTTTGLCYTPPRTQNAYNCTCSQDREGALGSAKDKEDKQLWTITKLDGTPACPQARCDFGEKVLITGYNGQKLQDLNGVVGVHSDSTGMEEEWTITDADDNKVLITSHRNKHLEDRGGVIGVHEDTADWQKWTITDAGDGKVFITSHQKQQIFPEDAIRMPAPGVEQCHHLRSRSLASLFSMFDNQPINLLKMDCEGCEKALLPSLTELPEQKILQFSGELHAVDNPLEDVVCKFDEGKFFIHVCLEDGKYIVVPLKERCSFEGRASCKDY